MTLREEIIEERTEHIPSGDRSEEIMKKHQALGVNAEFSCAVIASKIIGCPRVELMELHRQNANSSDKGYDLLLHDYKGLNKARINVKGVSKEDRFNKFNTFDLWPPKSRRENKESRESWKKWSLDNCDFFWFVHLDSNAMKPLYLMEAQSEDHLFVPSKKGHKNWFVRQKQCSNIYNDFSIGIKSKLVNYREEMSKFNRPQKYV